MTAQDITSFEGVYYRYTTDKIMDVSGEPQVRQVSLQMVSPAIDAEAGTATVTVRPTSNFPADELDKLSDKSLVVCLNISVASIIKPAAGSVRLGVVADWSKPNTYIITAADGSDQTMDRHNKSREISQGGCGRFFRRVAL